MSDPTHRSFHILKVISMNPRKSRSHQVISSEIKLYNGILTECVYTACPQASEKNKTSPGFEV